MNQLIILAACVAAASAWGHWKEGLRVRYDPDILGAGRTAYIAMPRTIAAAKTSRWVETPRPKGPLPSLVMFCPSRDDVAVCCLFDDLGNVAGVQIALPKDVWTDYVFDLATQGMTSWKAPANSKGVKRSYWTIQQYYVSEVTLKKSKAERLASYVEGRVLQENAVWLTGFNKKLMKISAVASEVTNTAKTMFTKQACIDLMGRHYNYDMSAATPCTSDRILPWFPILDMPTNQLVATGFSTFGKLPASKLVRDYFERPSRNQTQTIMPNGAQCMYDLAENQGAITMHIYYVDAPLLINCRNDQGRVSHTGN